MRFSIIIPLEFHRGLAEKCIRGWSMDQTYSRDDFEILVAAPETHDAAELALLAALLGPQDRILKYPFTHDMPLVAEAAREARGEVLVFTEAHCLPAADFLAQAAAVLDEQPTWAGFSGRSIPSTHNLLSEIEAEMYDEDISRNMQQHPWLQVLDQCFIIRRQAYQAVGGIEPEYGHFAEWLIAARLHRGKLKVGYDPRPTIQHFYVGDLHELEEFTADFAAGQIRFAEGAATDPCGDLFAEVPAWQHRHERDSGVCGKMLRMLLLDLVRHFTLRTDRSLLRKLRDWPWGVAGQWLVRNFTSRHLLALASWWRRRSLRRETERHLRRSNKSEAKAAFLQLMDFCVIAGWQERLAQWQNSPAARDFAVTEHDHSEWRPGRLEYFPAVGFHSLEFYNCVRFRWSQPVAMISLPHFAGDWRIVVETPPLAQQQRADARFYFNGVSIPSKQVTHFADRSELIVTGNGKSGTLAWACPAFQAPNDARQLGFPISCVTWSKLENLPALQTQQEASRSTTYFLHVEKCAGTTTRLLLTNAFAAEDILAPFEATFYYAHQLPRHPEISHAYSFAVGHFGWELPTRVPHRQWQIVTVVRDPLDRLLSKFHYLQQHDRLPAEVGLTQWFEHKLQFNDLISPYFIPQLLNREERGARALGQRLKTDLAQAIDNASRCAVMGLQERLDESIDLLCWKLDQLPPPQVPRVNVTISRTKREDIDPHAAALYAEHLQTESNFYEHARSLFAAQLIEMQQSIADKAGARLDAPELRRWLRRRFFARHSAAVGPDALPGELAWQARDAFLGFNLHDRERHGDYELRWTGPTPTTEFYAAIDVSRPMKIVFRLHPATPTPHALQARLEVNGQNIELQCQATARGLELSASFQAGPPPVDNSLFSVFRLTTPTVREAGAFRDIGVALCSIELRTAASAASPRQRVA